MSISAGFDFALAKFGHPHVYDHVTNRDSLPDTCDPFCRHIPKQLSREALATALQRLGPHHRSAVTACFDETSQLPPNLQRLLLTLAFGTVLPSERIAFEPHTHAIGVAAIGAVLDQLDRRHAIRLTRTLSDEDRRLFPIGQALEAPLKKLIHHALVGLANEQPLADLLGAYLGCFTLVDRCPFEEIAAIDTIERHRLFQLYCRAQKSSRRHLADDLNTFVTTVLDHHATQD